MGGEGGAVMKHGGRVRAAAVAVVIAGGAGGRWRS